MTDLSYGFVAKQVGVFSGCSIHNLKSILSACSTLAIPTNSASSFACDKFMAYNVTSDRFIRGIIFYLPLKPPCAYYLSI